MLRMDLKSLNEHKLAHQTVQPVPETCTPRLLTRTFQKQVMKNPPSKRGGVVSTFKRKTVTDASIRKGLALLLHLLNFKEICQKQYLGVVKAFKKWDYAFDIFNIYFKEYTVCRKFINTSALLFESNKSTTLQEERSEEESNNRDKHINSAVEINTDQIHNIFDNEEISFGRESKIALLTMINLDSKLKKWEVEARTRKEDKERYLHDAAMRIKRDHEKESKRTSTMNSMFGNMVLSLTGGGQNSNRDQVKISPTIQLDSSLKLSLKEEEELSPPADLFDDILKELLPRSN